MPCAQHAGGVDGSELDVEVLRVALAREQWEGLPGTYAPSAKQQAGMHINRPGCAGAWVCCCCCVKWNGRLYWRERVRAMQPCFPGRLLWHGAGCTHGDSHKWRVF